MAEQAARRQLAERMDALWAMLARRDRSQPTSLRDCWRLASEMQVQAVRLDLPALGQLLRRLASGFAHRAGDGTPLGFDETVDLAAWCETASMGLREGLAGDEIALLFIADEVPWLPPWSANARAAVEAALAAELAPPAASAPEPSVEPEAAIGMTEDGPSSDDETLSTDLRTRLGALGVDVEGLDEADLVVLAEVMLAGEGADSQAHASASRDVQAPVACPDAGVPVADDLVAVQAALLTPVATGPAEASIAALHAPSTPARELLRAHGVDLDGLAEEDIEALAAAFGDDTGSGLDEPLAMDLPDPCLGTAQSTATTPEPETGTPAGTIWIADEELALTRSAIAEQVMPMVMALVEASGDHERVRARDDLGYQLGLIANAMELFGIPSLHRLMLALAAHCGAEASDGEALLRISAALLSYLDNPDAEGATLLGDIAEESSLADPGFTAALIADTERIQLGIDPALLAQRKRSVEPEDIDLRPAPDVLPNVLSSMLRELPGNAERLGAAMRALAETGDTAPIDEARRVAHTLKGDANTVGVHGLANLTHALEDALIELLKSPERLEPDLASFLIEAADVVEECADHLQGRGPAPAALAEVYQQALDWANALFEGTALSHAAPAPAPHPPLDSGLAAGAVLAPTVSAPVAASISAPAAAAPEAPTQTLAVDTRLLDDLQRLAGELLVLSRQIDQRIDVLTGVERELRREAEVERGLTAQLDDLVALRGAALQSAVLQASAQVDALELDQYNELHTVSRQLIESNSDNQELLRRIDRVLRDLDPLRVQQQRLNDEIQRAIGRTRTLPFSEIAPRLQRVVRQTARQVGKDVDLIVRGETVAIDAEMLERLVEPLSHVLRNAIDHGIESPDARQSAGKAAKGQIALTVSTAGDSVQVQISDDGRGLDLPVILAKAAQIGLVTADANLTDDAIARLILAPGFSTREAVSQVSGRGVGMDVVNQRVRELRGVLSLHSEQGRSTTVSLRLPLSRTLADVIVIHGHEVSMAVVASAVTRIVQLGTEQMGLDDEGQLHMNIDGEACRAYPIETLFPGLSGRSLPGTEPCLGLVVEMIGGQREVLCVREVAEVTRAVVKPISPLLPVIPAVRGVTQLGDGRLVPVVDGDTLLERQRDAGTALATSVAADIPLLPRVVVADDSLSVRRALEQLMQDAGFEVAAARDGLEALQLIAERPPVAVLLDLEMPRMNGLEVCRYLRNRTELRDVPVVMITSRASDKYKLMAEEAGVTRLLGKPFSEDALVTLVRGLVEEVAERHGEMLFQ
jgi:chemotaxis protein histidine kinase CheA/ActR/RegA family two-component response regulator